MRRGSAFSSGASSCWSVVT
uniref:Uncharacterized protein n=1 Tax=Zea mays TaxID=4577 RepID=C4J3B3_MAIZE|nr:unknown [Zea mays]